jgi:hypothetical protein
MKVNMESPNVQKNKPADYQLSAAVSNCTANYNRLIITNLPVLEGTQLIDNILALARWIGVELRCTDFDHYNQLSGSHQSNANVFAAPNSENLYRNEVNNEYVASELNKSKVNSPSKKIKTEVGNKHQNLMILDVFIKISLVFLSSYRYRFFVPFLIKVINLWGKVNKGEKVANKTHIFLLFCSHKYIIYNLIAYYLQLWILFSYFILHFLIIFFLYVCVWI